MPAHLLLVEDNAADALLLQNMLDVCHPGQYAAVSVETLAEAKAVVWEQTFDAVLLDLSLPDSHGLETIGRLAAAAPNLPIVVLTGVDDEAVATEAVRSGAQDYLVKGQADATTIAHAIQYAIDRKQGEEALCAQRRELEEKNKQLQETQRRLEAYRDRYIDLYDFAPLGYVTLDEDGYVQEINLAGARLLNVDREGLTGYPLSAYVVKEDMPAFLDHLRTCVEGRCETTSELRLAAQGGRLITVQLHSIPIVGTEKDATLCKTAITDITERKRREQRIARLASLKEALLGLCGLREKLQRITDGVVEVFDADFARIWVVDAGDLCSKGCRHAAVTEGPDVCRDRSRCLHLVASSGRYTATDGSHRRVPLGCYKIGRIASGEESKFITNDVTHDPRVHDRGWAAGLQLVSFAGYRLLSPQNTPLGALALFSKQEIDDEEDALLEDLANAAAQVIQTGRTEELLRQEKVLADIVIDSIPGLFYVLDCQGRFVRWNHLLEEATGLSAEMLRGSDALQTILADDRAFAASKIREVFANGQAEAEARFLSKDGVRHYWFTGRRMVIGQDSYLVGSGIDITDRKRAEEALQQEHNLLRMLIDHLPDHTCVKDEDCRS